LAVYTGTIGFSTPGEIEVLDITPNVSKIVTASGLKDGIVCVFVPGATGATTTGQAGVLMVTGMAGMKEAKVRDLATRYFDTRHQHRIYRPMAHMVDNAISRDMRSSIKRVLPHWATYGVPAPKTKAS